MVGESWESKQTNEGSHRQHTTKKRSLAADLDASTSFPPKKRRVHDDSHEDEVVKQIGLCEDVTLDTNYNKETNKHYKESHPKNQNFENGISSSASQDDSSENVAVNEIEFSHKSQNFKINIINCMNVLIDNMTKLREHFKEWMESDGKEYNTNLQSRNNLNLDVPDMETRLSNDIQANDASKNFQTRNYRSNSCDTMDTDHGNLKETRSMPAGSPIHNFNDNNSPNCDQDDADILEIHPNELEYDNIYTEDQTDNDQSLEKTNDIATENTFINDNIPLTDPNIESDKERRIIASSANSVDKHDNSDMARDITPFNKQDRVGIFESYPDDDTHTEVQVVNDQPLEKNNDVATENTSINNNISLPDPNIESVEKMQIIAGSTQGENNILVHKQSIHESTDSPNQNQIKRKIGDIVDFKSQKSVLFKGVCRPFTFGNCHHGAECRFDHNFPNVTDFKNNLEKLAIDDLVNEYNIIHKKYCTINEGSTYVMCFVNETIYRRETKIVVEIALNIVKPKKNKSLQHDKDTISEVLVATLKYLETISLTDCEDVLKRHFYMLYDKLVLKIINSDPDELNNHEQIFIKLADFAIDKAKIVNINVSTALLHKITDNMKLYSKQIIHKTVEIFFTTNPSIFKTNAITKFKETLKHLHVDLFKEYQKLYDIEIKRLKMTPQVYQ